MRSYLKRKNKKNCKKGIFAMIGALSFLMALAPVAAKSTITSYAAAQERYPNTPGTWEQVDNTIQWKFKDENGVYLTNTWVMFNNQWYYMDTDGIMATSSWVDNDTYWVDGFGAWWGDTKSDKTGIDSAISG